MMGRPQRSLTEQRVRDLRELGRKAELRHISGIAFARAEMTHAIARRNINGDPELYVAQNRGRETTNGHTVSRSLNDRTPFQYLPLGIGNDKRRGYAIYSIDGTELQTVATADEARAIIGRAQRKGY
jgi:hypothetical protein